MEVSQYRNYHLYRRRRADQNLAYQLLNSIFGWNNTATQGTIGVYILYWTAIVAHLVYLKWKEGRIQVFGKWSKTGRIRFERRRTNLGPEGEVTPRESTEST